MKIGNLTVGLHNTSGRNCKRKRGIGETVKGILEFNIGRQYWKTTEIDETAWKDTWK